MDDSEKELVRARTDIVALISQYTPLRRTGSKYKGLCPFHQEKTPSFNVDPVLGRWRCFGACSDGGDVFKFLEKAEGLTFREALETLAERAGVTLTRGNFSPEEQAEAQSRREERDRIYAVNALALRFFRESYARFGLAQEYARKRGLSHQTLEEFGVGYAPEDWSALARFLRAQKAHLEDAETAGLVFSNRRADDPWTDRFRGRLIFPIVDTQERVVGFGGRLLVPAENAPKYLNSPETPVFSKSKILYALNRARKAIEKAGLVVVVEGYMDAVACHQAGIANVVATLGTSLTDEHVRLIRRYTKNVVLSFDADDAGVRAALRAAELFRSAQGRAGAAGESGSLRVLSLPPGEDPDSLLAKGQAAAFRKAVEAAMTVPAFQIKTFLGRYDLKTDEGKLAFLREALPVVAGVPSVLEQDVLIRRLAAYHPAFASGGPRAEESLRLEMARLRQTGGIPDAPYSGAASAPTAGAPLSGDIIIPPRRGGRLSGGGRFGRDGSGDGGPAADRPYSGQAPQQRRSPYGPPPAAPTPPQTSAADRAERTLLRALLSDDWSAATARQLAGADPARFFADELAGRLVAAVAPLLDGRISPGDAVRELKDGDLVDLAAEFLLADGDDDEPLSETMIADCLRTLRVRSERAAGNEQTAKAQREGNDALSAEELRQWYRRSQAMKNGGQERQEQS